MVSRFRELLQLLLEKLIFAGSGIVEQVLDMLVSKLVKGTHLRNGGLSFRAANGRGQPLEALLVHRIIGKHITRGGKRDRAISLKLSPHADTLARFCRRQGEDKQEPRTGVLVHRYAHSTR